MDEVPGNSVVCSAEFRLAVTGCSWYSLIKRSPLCCFEVFPEAKFELSYLWLWPLYCRFKMSLWFFKGINGIFCAKYLLSLSIVIFSFYTLRLGRLVTWFLITFEYSITLGGLNFWLLYQSPRMCSTCLCLLMFIVWFLPMYILSPCAAFCRPGRVSIIGFAIRLVWIGFIRI